MIFQNAIVQFVSFFIPDREMRHSFRKRYKRRTKYRKLRDDLSEVIREIKGLKREIKGHIDLRLNSYFNTFFDYNDIKYNNPDLKIFQSTKNLMLLELKKICEKNSIEYWLDFGTLLGAVRHQGFIPWDDDIDVGMTRDDFNKLEKAIDSSHLLKLRKLFYPDGTSFVKVILKLENIGLSIDIFIYDFINVDDYKLTIYGLTINKEKLVSDLKMIKDHKYSGIGPIRNLFYEENKAKINLIFNNYLLNSKVLLNSGSHIANLTNLWREYYLYDKSSLFPLKKISFEGTEHFVPKNIEEFLRVEFKYYIMLPYDTGKIKHDPILSHKKITALKDFIEKYKDTYS